jgi:hypothetical protein
MTEVSRAGTTSGSSGNRVQRIPEVSASHFLQKETRCGRIRMSEMYLIAAVGIVDRHARQRAWSSTSRKEGQHHRRAR